MPARAVHAPILTPPRVWSGLFGLLVVSIAIFLMLFQWNWLRGPLARRLSAALDRPVTITGDLKVHLWSFKPWASVGGVTIGNPAWAGRAPMASLPHVTVQVDLKPLILSRRLILPLVEADHPDVRLLRDAAGRENWRNHTGGKPSPLRLPAIRRLVSS